MPTIVRKGAVSKMGVAYAMPLSQMFDKVFGMIKSDMYVIKLQEKEGELSVLDTTNRQIRVICLRRKIFHCF